MISTENLTWVGHFGTDKGRLFSREHLFPFFPHTRFNPTVLIMTADVFAVDT